MHVRYRNGSPSWYASMCSSSWESGVANSTEFSTRAGVIVDVPGGWPSLLECMGASTVVVVAKTSLQPRSWLESVALRSVEAQGLG
jgi:hypothetical protein